ncbi:MAG: branched-chain amino acid transport system II carrier protein [Cellulosilyticaceae bacterium]
MKKTTHIFIIGFMLFASFFGAGNLIFPPYLGATSGSQWFTSFLGFIVSDLGVILLSIYAIAKAGSYQNIAGRVGKKFGFILEVIMMLCLGPILVIPRTSATTFEMSVMPIMSDFNPLLFSLIFFGIVFVLTIRPSRVVDIIGKYLTPILLGGLAILIIKGILSPVGELSSTITSNTLFLDGVTQGYQTMDALGTGGITAFVMLAFRNKGYTDDKEISRLTINAALVACIGLVLAYGGLAYLGATVSSIYTPSISQTQLLVSITSSLLGNSGIILLGIIVAFACLTTAIGLTSITANYFAGLTEGKFKYEYVVSVICLFSTLMSILGVDQIISIAVPVLTVLYPVTIILVLMGSLTKLFSNDMMFRGAAYTTLVVSTLTVMNSPSLQIPWIEKLPLSQYGFGWLLPALIGALIGKLIHTRTHKRGAFMN